MTVILQEEDNLFNNQRRLIMRRLVYLADCVQEIDVMVKAGKPARELIQQISQVLAGLREVRCMMTQNYMQDLVTEAFDLGKLKLSAQELQLLYESALDIRH